VIAREIVTVICIEELTIVELYKTCLGLDGGGYVLDNMADKGV
jgi:hypothetical protein